MIREVSPREEAILSLVERARQEHERVASHAGRAALASVAKGPKQSPPDIHNILRDEADGLGRRILWLSRLPHLPNLLGGSAIEVVKWAEPEAPEYGPGGKYHITYQGRRTPAVVTPMMQLSSLEMIPVDEDGDDTMAVRFGYEFAVPRIGTFYKHLVVRRFVLDEAHGTQAHMDTFEVAPDYASRDIGYRVWHGDPETMAQFPHTSDTAYPVDAYELPLGFVNEARAQLRPRQQPQLVFDYAPVPALG